MTDKGVGEALEKRVSVLRALYPDRNRDDSFEDDVEISLIRKLVEERAWYYEAQRGTFLTSVHRLKGGLSSGAIMRAMNDFGIRGELTISSAGNVIMKVAG
jgi:hypothetical protein